MTHCGKSRFFFCIDKKTLLRFKDDKMTWKNFLNSKINDLIFENTRVKADIFWVTEKVQFYWVAKTTNEKKSILSLKYCISHRFISKMYILADI